MIPRKFYSRPGLVLTLMALFATMPYAHAETLTNLVSIAADSVTFSPNILTTLLGAAVVLTIAAGAAIGLAVFGAKALIGIFKSMFGRKG